VCVSLSWVRAEADGPAAAAAGAPAEVLVIRRASSACPTLCSWSVQRRHCYVMLWNELVLGAVMSQSNCKDT